MQKSPVRKSHSKSHSSCPLRYRNAPPIDRANPDRPSLSVCRVGPGNFHPESLPDLDTVVFVESLVTAHPLALAAPLPRLVRGNISWQTSLGCPYRVFVITFPEEQMGRKGRKNPYKDFVAR